MPFIEQKCFYNESIIAKLPSSSIFSKIGRMDQTGFGKLKHPEIGFLMKRSRIVSLISLMLSPSDTEEASFVRHSFA